MPDKLCYIVKSTASMENEWNWVLDQQIEQVVRERGFCCEVGPPLGANPYPVERDIARLIQADLVIIDVTECEDLRVFYQLGIRHARASRTVLIAQDDKSLDEDVASYHKLTYPSGGQGFEDFCKALAEALDQLTAHPHEPDNAVQEYLQGKGKVEEHAEEIVRLRRKVERLEQEIKSNPPPPRRDERIEFKPVS
jgi:hypothetical protein